MKWALFKFIRCAALDVFETLRSLPHYITVVQRAKRRQVRLLALEEERLDRIRNPAKYLGR